MVARVQAQIPPVSTLHLFTEVLNLIAFYSHEKKEFNGVHSSVEINYNTCETDFKKMRILEAFSKNWSDICFTLFNPASSPSFKISDDKGIRIMVESVNDHALS